jgi:RimJ/RimL family protein N-acetyltransferase
MIGGDRHAVCDFVNAAIRDGADITERYEALGAVDATGRIIGGFIFYDWERANGNIYIAAAGSGAWVTPGNLRVWFSYPFNQLKCNRITSMVAKSNKVSREMTERLGFKREGCIRAARGPGKDSIVYGMLRNECRWIG